MDDWRRRGGSKGAIMSDDIMVSVLAKDYGASGKAAKREDPKYSNLTTGTPGYLEWTVTLPWSGKWRLHTQHAAADGRPCTLVVNGVKQDEPIFGEQTGGWQADSLAWFVHGPYDFQKGENVLRIEVPAALPCLKQFGFSPVEAPAPAWPFPRQAAPVKRDELVQPHLTVDVEHGDPEDLFYIRIYLLHGANYNDPAGFDHARVEARGSTCCPRCSLGAAGILWGG